MTSQLTRFGNLRAPLQHNSYMSIEILVKYPLKIYLNIWQHPSLNVASIYRHSTEKLLYILALQGHLTDTISQECSYKNISAQLAKNAKQI